MQHRLRRLDDTLQGKCPRESGPPLLGEILDRNETEQLRAEGYNFQTVVTDINHVQWDKVVEVEGQLLNPEAEIEELEVPAHGKPVSGQYLVKLINSNYVQLFREKATRDVNIQTGNFKKYFSMRSR